MRCQDGAIAAGAVREPLWAQLLPGRLWLLVLLLVMLILLHLRKMGKWNEWVLQRLEGHGR